MGPRTVADMKRIVENGLKVCEATNSDPAETPWYVGFVQLEPPPEHVLERGRELAKKYGW